MLLKQTVIKLINIQNLKNGKVMHLIFPLYKEGAKAF